jgi:YedE family putative selenium metabolism protein
MSRDLVWVLGAGAVLGAAAVVLTELGNPGNMGFCIACFQRDIAGALGLFHWSSPPLPIRYIRPEILGIVLGAFLTALAFREFRPKGGSAPATRFLLGILVMVGALVFLGCPTRMVLRLGGGDLNALTALGGFAAGIAVGVFLLRRGFNLGRARRQGFLDGIVLPAFMVLLLLFLVFRPVFIPGGPVIFSPKGHPGGAGSPVGTAVGVLVSLGAGLAVGFLAQRSRLCFVGGIRDLILIRSGHLLWGFVVILAVVLAGNLLLGSFRAGFENQPVAHAAHLWNVLGMGLVGIGSVLLGGCPMRQLVLAGSGNTDSAVSVFGMMTGAALAHNLGLVKAASTQGKVAVIMGLALCVFLAAWNREK